MPILTPTEELKRILVSRTDGLGDLIVTLPIAVALKSRLPDVEVAYLVTPYTAPIARRVREIDRTLPISKLRRALHVMKIYRPDALIFAKPDLRLAIEGVMARVDVRIGTGYRWYSGLFTRWVYEHRKRGAKHEAEYSVGLLSPILSGELPVRMPELEVSASGAEEAETRLKESGIVGDYIVIHPGSRGSAATYPVGSYAAVATKLRQEFPDLSLVVTAGPGEEVMGRELVERAGGGVVIAGISLDGLSELLRGARGFLGNSSGPAHLAALVRTPVVALYPGLPPMWPARWRPLGGRVTTLVPSPEEPICDDCEKKHPPENCVARIGVERVVEACVAMIAGADADTAEGARVRPNDIDT